MTRETNPLVQCTNYADTLRLSINSVYHKKLFSNTYPFDKHTWPWTKINDEINALLYVIGSDRGELDFEIN